MICSWCDDEATYYLLSDRNSRNSTDSACEVHADQYGHLYRRRVAIPARVVDLRDVSVADAPEARPATSAEDGAQA